VLVSDLAAGELVTQTRLGPARAGPVASLVPGGMRAVDVPVSADPADVVPGDRVDVLATFGGGQPHTETPGVGLEVLAVAGGGGAGVIPASSETGGDGGPTVTLLVTPEEAESLAYASAFATLSISVLGPDDSGATFGTGG
jgi:Flp pilus assembly protein CpaB